MADRALNYLLVTNDFPPKVGGIQNYLWELWRRLPPEHTSVYCTPHEGAVEFDAKQRFKIERSPEPVLIPYPWLGARIRRIAKRTKSRFVLLDPALPLGHIGPNLGIDYGVVLHGAEVTIPARLPGTGAMLRRTLRSSSLVVSAGDYALAEAERCVGHSLPAIVVPPGVDSDRFRPGSAQDRRRVRANYDVGDDEILLSAVSRLVPRKGFDTVIRALANVNDELNRISAQSTSSIGQQQRTNASGARRVVAVIGGSGREQKRLQHLASQLKAPVRFPGKLSDPEVVDLYGASDLMAMLCNERWFGLEQEGFGIAFLEAAASGLPQIAGRSGGSHEAVENGRTGIIIDDPTDHVEAAKQILYLVANRDTRHQMGEQARSRAVAEFDYDHLAQELHVAVTKVIGGSKS